MSDSIITADKFNTIKWSGGTSTQLYIYPETADYGLKNFDLRLSTAKVEVEKSDFTPLSGISRHIMILDGEIEIFHKDQYRKKLKQFDMDEFEGGWETSSLGTCIDFNLMTKGKTKGNLNSLKLKKNQHCNFPISKLYSKQFIYLYTGKISFILNNKELILKQGELLVLDNLNIQDIQFNAIENSDIVISQVAL